jgi:TetR/AcrR family transcriptional regulator, regulator of cefoperazone and chloramphenicol sensitivity
MKKDEVKEQLISAAVELLQEAENPEKITSREIAARADANLAMINYYFESKDQLLILGISQIMEKSADRFLAAPESFIPPRKRLKNMLYELCEMVVKYNRFTKIYIPYIFLRDDILVPFYIIPILREYFGEQKTELECKIIAYQIISFLQLIFFRSDAFRKYTDLDIMDAAVRENLIDMQLNLFLGREEKE